MNLNDYFKRIILITEKNEETRRINLFRTFNSYGIRTEASESVSAGSLVLPNYSFFTKEELGELLSIYRIVHRAYLDQVSPILVLKDTVNVDPDYKNRVGSILNQMPGMWDIIYFGHNEFIPKTVQSPAEEKSNAQIIEAWWASSNFALAFNYSFYSMFLDHAQIPTRPLDWHLKSLGLKTKTFVVNPPLFYLNS